MLAPGVAVSYETIRQWCQEFGQTYANGLRRRRAHPGDKWHFDEVFITINGKTHYLWRAVDQHGVVLDILVQSRRNAAVTSRKGIERHHIFPKAFLKRQGIIDTKRINQIANMALVEWSNDIDISDEAPTWRWPAQISQKRINALRLIQQQYWQLCPRVGKRFPTRSSSSLADDSWAPLCVTHSPNSPRTPTLRPTPPPDPQPTPNQTFSADNW